MAARPLLRYLEDAMATATLMTVEELAALPEDGHVHELVQGELSTMPPPHFPHADIVYSILQSLIRFLAANPVGRAYPEAGFLLNDKPSTVRQPDIGFVSAERLSRRMPNDYFPGAPDLAIEVVSPSDKAADLDLKIRQYLNAESKAVIVVYPQTRTVWIHRPTGSPQLLDAGRNLEIPDVLPGWALPLAEIFAPLDEIKG